MKYSLIALLIVAAMTTTIISGCSSKAKLTPTEFTPEQKKQLEQRKEQQNQDEANRYGRPR